MFCNTYLDDILSSGTSLEISIIILFGIILTTVCYFFKKYWASIILTFILAAILEAYFLRSDILNDSFGNYVKQENSHIIELVERFGPLIIAIVISYCFIIRKIVFSRKKALIVLIISAISSFILGFLIFFSVACP